MPVVRSSATALLAPSTGPLPPGALHWVRMCLALRTRGSSYPNDDDLADASADTLLDSLYGWDVEPERGRRCLTGRPPLVVRRTLRIGARGRPLTASGNTDLVES